MRLKEKVALVTGGAHGMGAAEAKLFAKEGGGSIVNISSISGIAGQTVVHMGYNASKGAVRVMTKSAAVQYATQGIRANSVHPGVMPPMLTSNQNPETRAKLPRGIPMNR